MLFAVHRCKIPPSNLRHGNQPAGEKVQSLGTRCESDGLVVEGHLLFSHCLLHGHPVHIELLVLHSIQ